MEVTGEDIQIIIRTYYALERFMGVQQHFVAAAMHNASAAFCQL